MHLGRLRARKLRERVILLLLPLLASRVLVPDGFMPRFDAGHQVSMQMCHGDAQSAAAMRLLREPPAAPATGDRGSPRHESPCVFAASSGVAPPAMPPPLLDAAPPPCAPALPAPVVPVLRLAHRIQSARAPPLPV